MGFEELNLKYYYNNDEDDLIEDFYNPILMNANIYKRASGFFSSSSFWSFIEGLREFINKDGMIQLIISPELSEKDIEYIILGEKAKEESIEGFLVSKILEENKYKDQFNLLAWLIYQEKLQIKIIVKRDFRDYGIFHDKLAVVEDEYGKKIAFHGSLNESQTGIVDNFESINVFMDWNDTDKKRIYTMERLFNSLWNNTSKKWVSYEIPESIKKRIIKERRPLNRNKESDRIIVPEKYILRSYQKEAIKKWFLNNCNGILEMATGSGKTLTAIFALIETIKILNSKGYPCGVVIVVPYKNLLEQWCEELSEFNIKPIKCYESKALWYHRVQCAINNFNKYNDEKLVIITTNATFISESFQRILYKIQRNYIFCADEMHHLLSSKISSLLPKNTDMRLGLTATLGNKNQEEKVKQVKEYFTDIVYSFNLEDAIKNNCLTKYYYYPIFIELTDNEMDEYLQLNYKISKLINSDEESEVLKILLNQRRRIVFNAENKIKKFSAMKSELLKYKRTLVYCGDKIDDDRFINKINKIIYDMGIKTHTYTSELNRNEREKVLNEFKNGDIEVLTSIRCLDEGVNIPSIDCAFILSSNMDSKQFIQRRGRILRKAPNKEFSYIYDFIVIPSLNKEKIKTLDFEIKEVQKKIITRELERFYEFANLSENKVEALAKIVDIIKLYS
ncbi:MAG: DEAD/DEAH box helicase family protein [Clostridium sp.]|uniref:DEAD/DEAH box helicase family protein n=1 Tax=Clostridium sp. TaxID=1506 RepID=UPI003992DA08